MWLDGHLFETITPKPKFERKKWKKFNMALKNDSYLFSDDSLGFMLFSLKI